MRVALNLEIQTTADGSSTIYLPDMDEHYHSVNGAIVESRHIYIRNGLYACPKKEISVLEVGFGTGLNAIQTLMACEEKNLNVRYTTYEKYPLPEEITGKLRFDLDEGHLAMFRKIHQVGWNECHEITPQFSLRKVEADLTVDEISGEYDVVYFDAFAPDKQPDLWNEVLFHSIYEHLNQGGVFVTYCAKGAVRRALQSVGFTTFRLPGPPGKREILQAKKL